MVRFMAFATAIAVGACSAQIEMYPVEGPLSKEVPLPVVHATADGVTGGSGSLSLTMPDGEACKGKWSSVAPQYASFGAGSLIGTYGQRIGLEGASVGIVPGINKGHAFVTCDRGTTVEAEFLTGSGTANGYGVAKDSNGNIFKMLF